MKAISLPFGVAWKSAGTTLRNGIYALPIHSGIGVGVGRPHITNMYLFDQACYVLIKRPAGDGHA